MNHEVPDFVPDGLLDGPAPAEGFTEVICSNCDCTMQVPIGPDFWDKAVFGVSKCLQSFTCHCGARITHVVMTPMGPRAMFKTMGYPPEGGWNPWLQSEIIDPPEEPA